MLERVGVAYQGECRGQRPHQHLAPTLDQRDRLEVQREGFVTAGRLGARYLELQGRPWARFPRPQNPPSGDCASFVQTGHHLCGVFRGYCERNGGLERFGYPITEPFEELLEGRSYLVQYFERRRLEYHPDYESSPDVVQRGLLGNEVYGKQLPPLRP